MTKKRDVKPLATWDLVVQDHEAAVLRGGPQPVPTDDAHLIATHRERGAVWDCPSECGCADAGWYESKEAW